MAAGGFGQSFVGARQKLTVCTIAVDVKVARSVPGLYVPSV